MGSQVGDSLEEFLVDATPDPKLRQVLMSLSEAVRTIAFKVRTPALRVPNCRKVPLRIPVPKPNSALLLPPYVS